MRTMALPLMRAVIIIPLLHVAAEAASPLLPGPVKTGPPVLQMRTYVSGLGDDTYPCIVMWPCRTLQAALALTLPGGEIFVLNSADYGTVTINKAVTVTSEGAVAGVMAASGVGITISAGANDVINLRGLNIDGTNSGGNGILFSSGKSLNIQKSVIRGFAVSGINFAPNGASTLVVSDTFVTNNGNNGILVASGGAGAVNAALNRVTASGNGVGIFGSGANVSVTITDIAAGNNNYGIGASSAAVMVRSATISNNAVGIAADQAAIVRISQSTISANGTGWQSTNGGQVQSYGNNNVGGNVTNGTLTSTVALQ